MNYRTSYLRFFPKIFLPVLLQTLILVCASVGTATPGEPLLRIAVIDTGCDTSHPAIRPYINRGLAYNSIDQSSQVADNHGHGTHIVGLIIDQLRRAYPLGPPRFEIVPIKFYDRGYSSENTVEATIRAFHYAHKIQAQIINFSGGGPTASDAEIQILQQIYKSQSLLVAASGNENANIKDRPFFPASYLFSNILRVSSHSKQIQKSKFSNYDPDMVNISIEGENLYSTFPKGRFEKMSGTSQATAVASGIAAILWLRFPDLRKPQKMISYLEKTSVHSAQMKPFIRNGNITSFETALARSAAAN